MIRKNFKFLSKFFRRSKFLRRIRKLSRAKIIGITLGVNFVGPNIYILDWLFASIILHAKFPVETQRFSKT